MCQIGPGGPRLSPDESPNSGWVAVTTPLLELKKPKLRGSETSPKLVEAGSLPRPDCRLEIRDPTPQMGVCLCVHVHTRVYNLGGAAFSGRRRHFPRVFHWKHSKCALCLYLSSSILWWRNTGLEFRQPRFQLPPKCWVPLGR